MSFESLQLQFTEHSFRSHSGKFIKGSIHSLQKGFLKSSTLQASNSQNPFCESHSASFSQSPHFLHLLLFSQYPFVQLRRISDDVEFFLNICVDVNETMVKLSKEMCE